MRTALASVCVAAALLGLASGSEKPQAILVPACEHPAYRVHVVSSEPLVLYIRNFISESERRHLLTARYVHIPSRD
jgi:hypothetical protein